MTYKGTIVVDRWFRGRNIGVSKLTWAVCKNDYILVPKADEHYILEALEQYKPPPKRVLPTTIAMPPLLKVRSGINCVVVGLIFVEGEVRY